MSTLYFADQWPSFTIFLLLVALFSLIGELGYRIGLYQHRKFEASDTLIPKGLVGAVIALLAFMLAFTFGQANSHFSVKKQLVLEEANAIGTAYLRTDVLPKEQRQLAKTLLQEYVDVRLEMVAGGPKSVDAFFDRSIRIHDDLWSLAMAADVKEACFYKTGLLMEALNEVFDLHSKRVNATFRSRIPKGIRVTLLFLALAAIVLRGYTDGLQGKRRSIFVIVIFIATFTAVLVLIIDLDRPPFADRQILDVGQQALLDLKQSFQP